MINKVEFYSRNLPSEVISLLIGYEKDVDIDSEPDFYGASQIIALQLDLKSVPKSYSSWSHGCHDGFGMFTEHILWNEGWVLNKLVGNKLVSEYLIQDGVKNVYAVGLPFVYTPSLGIKKRLNSLLIMPAHSLEFVNVEHDIKSLVNMAIHHKEQGMFVCFCLHPDCLKQGDVTSVLDENNIDWFTGASATNSSSLQRMRNVFDYFEFVGSNTLGSHFFYSQLCGAKFFFIEPYFEFKAEMFINDPFDGKNLELCRKVLAESSLKAVKSRYPKYFGGIENAYNDFDLASLICGLNEKLSPKALSILLGWRWSEQLYGKLIGLKNRVSNKINRTINNT